MQFTTSAVTAVPNDDSRTREERSAIKGAHINKKKKEERDEEKEMWRSVGVGTREKREGTVAGAGRR